MIFDVSPAFSVKSVPPAVTVISKSTPELFCSILKCPSSVIDAVRSSPALVILSAIVCAVSVEVTSITAEIVSNSAVFPSSESLFVEIIKEPSVKPEFGTTVVPKIYEFSASFEVVLLTDVVMPT